MWPRPHYIIANTPTEQSTEKPKNAEEEILWNVIRFECDFYFWIFVLISIGMLGQAINKTMCTGARVNCTIVSRPTKLKFNDLLTERSTASASTNANKFNKEWTRERERKPTEIIPDHEKGQRIRYMVYTAHTQSLNCVVVVIVATIAYANIFFSSTQTNL